MPNEFFYPHNFDDTWLDLKRFRDRYNRELNRSIGTVSILPALVNIDLTPMNRQDHYERVKISLFVKYDEAIFKEPFDFQVSDEVLLLHPRSDGVIIELAPDYLEMSRPFLLPFWEALKADFTGVKEMEPTAEQAKGDKPNFGKVPHVVKRRKEIYNRREQILDGRLTVQMLAEEYTKAPRGIEEDLRELGISRK